MIKEPKLTPLRIDLMKDMAHPAGLDPAALNRTEKKLVDGMSACGWVTNSGGNFRLTSAGRAALSSRPSI